MDWNTFKKKAGFEKVLKQNTMYSVQELINKYKEIRKKNGEKASNSSWIVLKHSWLYYQIKVMKKIKWHDFKKMAGYKKDSFVLQFKFSKLTLPELIQAYKKVREKHGDKARNVSGLADSGNLPIFYNVKKFNLTWNEFKAKAGYDDDPLFEIRKSLRVIGLSNYTISRITKV